MATIIDIACPLDKNLISTIAEKRRKYQPLAVELKDIQRNSHQGVDDIKEKLHLTNKHVCYAEGNITWHSKHCTQVPKPMIRLHLNIFF
ncbi:hypothetical protein B566_EDAN017260, partial [Ephemera danica]